MKARWRSLARLARSVLASQFTLPRHALKLTLALTERCSFSCQPCRIWTVGDPAEPSFDELRRFFGRNREFAWIDLVGGEIFERDDIDDILELIQASCPSLYLLHFATNGWWPDRVAQAVENAAGRGPARLILTVSVDGPEAVHDEVRGRPGSYRRAVETLQALRSLPGVRVFAGMTLGPRNVDLVEETLDALGGDIPGFGPGELHVNFVNRSAHYFHNLDCETAAGAEVLRAIGTLKRLRGFPLDPELVLEYLYLSLVPRFFRSGRTPVFCQSLSNNSFVAADWTLYPCTIWDRPLADLREVDFDLASVWRSPEVDRVRALVAARSCPNCWTPCEAYPSLMGLGRGLWTG